MTRLCAALLAVALLSGCTLGPVWSRRLEGHVIDARTGEPVAGALVTSHYSIALLMTHGTSSDVEAGWTRSDADGHFALPGRFIVRPVALAVTPRYPAVIAFHPEYGSAPAELPTHGSHWKVDRLDLQIRLHVDDYELERLVNPNGLDEICAYKRRPFCEQLCQAAYADSDLCSD